MMGPSDLPSSSFRSCACAFSYTAASASVRVGLSANCLGRSMGVTVALVQIPEKSGWPSAARGIAAALDFEDCAPRGATSRAASAVVKARNRQVMWYAPLLFFFCFHLACAVHDVGHGVVAFMARVFIHRTRRGAERKF